MTHSELKTKALRKKEVKEAYDALEPEFTLLAESKALMPAFASHSKLPKEFFSLAEHAKLAKG